MANEWTLERLEAWLRKVLKDFDILSLTRGEHVFSRETTLFVEACATSIEHGTFEVLIQQAAGLPDEVGARWFAKVDGVKCHDVHRTPRGALWSASTRLTEKNIQQRARRVTLDKGLSDEQEANDG